MDQKLKVPDLAKCLGLSVPTIYRYLSEGKLDRLPPAIKIGSTYRWRLSTVEAWMTEQEGKSSDAA